METGIIVAIITGTISLLLGIVNSILGYFKVIKPQRELKELEYKFNRLQMRDAKVDDISIKEFSALREAIIQIQIIKDYLQILLMNTDKSYFADIALQRIDDYMNKFIKSYENSFMDLPQGIAGKYHIAKEKVVKVNSLLKENLSNTEYVSTIINEVKEDVIKCRLELTEIQNEIRDYYYLHIFELTKLN
jgi:hypothetical protein